MISKAPNFLIWNMRGVRLSATHDLMAEAIRAGQDISSRSIQDCDEAGTNSSP